MKRDVSRKTRSCMPSSDASARHVVVTTDRARGAPFVADDSQVVACSQREVFRRGGWLTPTLWCAAWASDWHHHRCTSDGRACWLQCRCGGSWCRGPRAAVAGPRLQVVPEASGVVAAAGDAAQGRQQPADARPRNTTVSSPCARGYLPQLMCSGRCVCVCVCVRRGVLCKRWP
jgi:hypothetical protein